jgi:rhodanese-related sulfurtransferase
MQSVNQQGWGSNMSGFYDSFVARNGADASSAQQPQDADREERSRFGVWTFASIIAVPLLMVGWPENAYAQSSSGSEGSGGSSSQGQSSGPGGGASDAAGGMGDSTAAGAVTSGAGDVSGMMGGEGGERVIVIDVRPRADFLKGHLKNAKNLEVRYSEVLRDHLFDKAQLGANKSARIVVYGAGANDPAAAAVVRTAQAEGFSNVIWMRGGFAEWVAARLPTTPG